MSHALLRLKEQAQSFSNTEREVAASILADPRLVVDMSIHELARHTFSSASTIVRLCTHLGYSGYKEFRKSVTYELALRDQSMKMEFKEISRTDSLPEIIDKVTYMNIVSLEETKTLLNVQDIQTCVELLKKAKMIYLFGMGASMGAARDAGLKFLRLNKPCIVNEDWHSQLVQARNASREDLAIVFSYSGATVEVIECMKALRENGTPTIAITRCVESPVSKLADINLYTAANESLFRTGAMPSRMSQLNVVDILYTALANDDYDASIAQISRTHIHKPNEPLPKSQK